jgi:hypothetical protein
MLEHKILKWIKCEGKEGFKANFPVVCDQGCMNPNETPEEMFLRNSELTFLNSKGYGQVKVEPILKVMYKCKLCANVKWFFIGYPYMDNDYWNEIMKRRDNHFLYVPDPKTWSDDARIQQRLKDLGYLGGDIEYSEVTEVEE